MRKALCVGINYYACGSHLRSAVNDARSIGAMLEKHADSSPNFDVTCLTASDASDAISKADLIDAVVKFFADDPEVALFYFAGHGTTDRFGGYLCTSDTDLAAHSMGLPLEDLLKIVSESKAENKIIILDSCHSGSAGDFVITPQFSLLPQNTVILAACKKDESADELQEHGIFTYLLLDALKGAGANLLGEVTTTNVYSHIEKCLIPPDQRPVFKANIDRSIRLRTASPKISIRDMRQLTSIFLYPSFEYPLSPAYEEDKRDVEDKTRYPEKEEIFRVLRKYYQLNLVVPVGEEYMYWAAVRSKSCKLTPLGQYYWYQIYGGEI